jgi:2-hydroxy-6-oxonona-2,4-dienedioate hydrolase
MKRTGIVLTAALLGAGALMAAAYSAFSRDVREASRRTANGSEVIATSYGRVEYAIAGQGPPLLMIHGTGGGFDQGLLFTEAIVRRGYQVISPSRFGYLRSDFPQDASSEQQADAFVALLDKLGIQRLPVAGGSAGALAAVQFALRHPERCSALVLIVPAANVRGTDPVKMTRAQEFLVRKMSESDGLFWLGTKAFRDQMIATLLATDTALVHGASTAEQQRVNGILQAILPVSQRTRGMRNDAKLAGNPNRVDFTQVRVPTLVISAEDDRFGTANTARDIAAAVKGARLVLFPQGGHVWVGHDEELWAEVARFVESASPAEATPPVRRIR